VKVLLACIVALALAGCGLAGSAAKVGSDRISDAQLNAQVTEVLQAQGRSASTEDPDLIRQVLERMVVIELVDRLAEQEGIVITQGDLERLESSFIEQLGDREAFEATILQQQNLAPDQIEPYLRMNLQLTQLREMAGGDDEVFAANVVGFGQTLGVEVSPRFGTWIPETLYLAPPEDVLSDES
jgi:hypothetical protein